MDSLSVSVDPESVPLQPRTRYFWRVRVKGDRGDEAQAESWFETGKGKESWQGMWLTPDFPADIHPLLRKDFSLPADREVESARIYACGLGFYELYLNGEKVGDEYLAPGIHAYDFWQQVQTYDVTGLLRDRGAYTIGVMLGNGMYKGRFGFDGGYENLYGDAFAFIGELRIRYTDGTEETIATDSSWLAHPAPIQASGIYDGEVWDARMEDPDWCRPQAALHGWTPCRILDKPTEHLCDRLSLPVRIMDRRKPVKIHTTPKGDRVLDMGQNMTGWLAFDTAVPDGTELRLEYGELLQDGEFFRENLRTAKAEYRFIGDGRSHHVRPHFTWYGFRYVRLTGFQDPRAEDFTACILYSSMAKTGHIETSSRLVNRFLENVQWSQQDNFLDVPTDCPQRDERMGWTGDTQVFCNTASYNMDTAAFYTKYLHDLRQEQEHLHGSVPFFVPQIKPKQPRGIAGGHGSCGWGDVATVLPWQLYRHYGDKALLREQYPVMKDWVDYIRRQDDANGGHRLWTTGFHFADWLALDNGNPHNPIGGTDPYYIASAYYAYSAELTAKAAGVLGYTDEQKEYESLSQNVKAAIRREYFTDMGRCAIDTQTSLVLALYMHLVPESYRPRLLRDLKARLQKDGHLTTGFIGTAYLCEVLSAEGADAEAYGLLLNDSCPGWLYEVRMGATTVWERWNSLLPDGHMNPEGMNSLNHYAYGAVAGWLYAYVCGLQPLKPGFRRFAIHPHIYGLLRHASLTFDSPCGTIRTGWKLTENGRVELFCTVPFGAEVEVTLPFAHLSGLHTEDAGGLAVPDGMMHVGEDGISFVLPAGTYHFAYQPGRPLIPHFDTGMKLQDILSYAPAKQVLFDCVPELKEHADMLGYIQQSPVRELRPDMLGIPTGWQQRLQSLEKALGRIEQPLPD